MLYYPANFPKEKESLLKELFLFLVNEKPIDKKKLNQKIRIFLKHKNQADFFPSYWQLNLIYWRYFSNQKPPEFFSLMQKHQVRSLSGIVPLSLFTRPQKSCPFNCVYCTTQKKAPKSYFADEAAVMRAIRCRYSAFNQTRNRLIQFFLSSHPIDKVDVIIQGGTFSFYENKYRENFVKDIYNAANFPVKELIIKGQVKNWKKAPTLEEAKKINETSASRVVGLTIETRPDYINRKEILFLRRLGVTRVELGVQTLDEKVLNLIKRGHGKQEVVEATKLLRDAGFKITYHLMPGLPGSNFQSDLDSLREVFSSPDFLPDAVKFYPTQIVKGSQLYQWYQQGKYQPLQELELTKLVKIFKEEIIPPWVRIQRLVRDLTRDDLLLETFPSNFRQNLKIKCGCIRCREIRTDQQKGEIKINVINYQAAQGKEYFIEAVDVNYRLFGFIRLRIPDTNDAYIRELHVYGKQIPLGQSGKVQHLGLGTLLLQQAEMIALKSKVKKLAIISGVGVREYYRKFGYQLEKEDMVKNFDLKNAS